MLRDFLATNDPEAVGCAVLAVLAVLWLCRRARLARSGRLRPSVLRPLVVAVALLLVIGGLLSLSGAGVEGELVRAPEAGR